MQHEEIILETGKPILRPLGFAQAIFLLAFIISPFLWIWHSWHIAWKLGLTGIIGTIITHILYKVAKKIIAETINTLKK